MGAALGCCGGPSTDYEASFHKYASVTGSSSARYHPLLGRCDTVEKSLLRKLQRSLSTSWSARALEVLSPRSPLGISQSGSRYALDGHYESESDSDEELPALGGRGSGSTASATSGSRLLCDFYNLVLECDHSKSFFDLSGRRVKGAYLAEIEILEDYFDTTRRMTVGARRRRRESVEALPYQPPQKLLHLGSNAFYDRSSNMSLMSNGTSETMASDSDYWANFDDATSDAIDLVVGEMTFPPKLGAHHTPRRTRRDSVDRRRSWFLQEQQLFGADSSSSLLLFSPVNASSINDTSSTASTLAQQGSTSRSSMRGQSAQKPLAAVPTEGSRYNLWTSVAEAKAEAVTTKDATGLPTVFGTAAVSERRRASLTMGANANNNSNGTRRLSAHTIAPIAV